MIVGGERAGGFTAFAAEGAEGREGTEDGVSFGAG